MPVIRLMAALSRRYFIRDSFWAWMTVYVWKAMHNPPKAVPPMIRTVFILSGSSRTETAQAPLVISSSIAAAAENEGEIPGSMYRTSQNMANIIMVMPTFSMSSELLRSISRKDVPESCSCMAVLESWMEFRQDGRKRLRSHIHRSALP